MTTTQPTYHELFQRLSGIVAEQQIEKPWHRAAFLIDQAAISQTELGLDSQSARFLAEAAANVFRNSFASDRQSIEAIARAIQISMLEGS